MIKVITPQFRASYLTVFTPREDPNGNMKYSVSMLFPKDTDLSDIKAAIKQAATEKFGADEAKWPKALKNPIKDGDEKPEGDPGRGCWIINASSNETHPPGIVDERVQPILDQKDFYSGCYARASISVYGYDNVSKGVGVGLLNVQKIKDGDPLGGVASKAEDDFAAFKPAGGGLAF